MAVHAGPAWKAVALEGISTVSVLAVGQTNALRAVPAEPADLAGAGVGGRALTVGAPGVAHGRGAELVLVPPTGETAQLAVLGACVASAPLKKKIEANLLFSIRLRFPGIKAKVRIFGEGHSADL